MEGRRWTQLLTRFLSAAVWLVNVYVSLVPQERAEGGPAADAGGVQRVQENQGQIAPPGGPHQQTRLLQIHLAPPPPTLAATIAHIGRHRGSTSQLARPSHHLHLLSVCCRHVTPTDFKLQLTDTIQPWFLTNEAVFHLIRVLKRVSVYGTLMFVFSWPQKLELWASADSCCLHLNFISAAAHRGGKPSLCSSRLHSPLTCGNSLQFFLFCFHRKKGNVFVLGLYLPRCLIGQLKDCYFTSWHFLYLCRFTQCKVLFCFKQMSKVTSGFKQTVSFSFIIAKADST